MASKFTSLYRRTQKVVNEQTFAGDWQKFLVTDCGVKSLLAEDGLDSARAEAPNKIRKRIKDESNNAVVSFFVGGGVADVIYNAADNKKSPGKLIERAAALKMLRHMYRVSKKGGQDVWVYSPPKQYTQWVFEELESAADEKTIKSKLGKESEIFTEKEKQWMSDALAVARKISMDTQTKLAEKNKATKEMVGDWFLDQDCGDKEMEEAISKLSEGFKKISAACSSAKLLFTDYPDWRQARRKYFGAAFSGGEEKDEKRRFPVIYLEGAFTRLTGNSGKLWLCALTIIHELSHHEIGTKDHRYDFKGLKPDRTKFKYDKAIANADSWAYFATDLAGYLSKSDRTNTLK